MEDGGYAVPREAHGSWRRDGGYTCAQLPSPALSLNPAEVDGQDEIDVEKQQKCGWRWIHCSPLSCGDAGDGEDGEVELRECEEEVGARVRYGNALDAAGLVFMSRYAQERLVEDRM